MSPKHIGDFRNPAAQQKELCLHLQPLKRHLLRFRVERQYLISFTRPDAYCNHLRGISGEKWLIL